MAQNRVQTNDLRYRPEVRPTPVPGDTFVTPEKAPVDTRFEDLASSLGVFSSSLGRLGASMKASRAEADKLKATQQENAFNFMTEKDRQEVYRTGKINGEDISTAQLKKIVGANSGEAFATQMKEYLATQDLTAIEDVDGFILKQASEWSKANGGFTDPYMLSGFGSVVDSLRGWGQSQLSQAQATKYAETVDDQTFISMQNAFTKLIEAGVDPLEAVNGIRSRFKEIAGTNKLLGNKQVDDHLLTIAGLLSETHPEYAKAILGAERFDENGKSLGSLADKPATATRVAAMYERIGKAEKEIASTEVIRDAKIKNLQRLDQNDYSRLEDITLPNGKTYTATEQNNDRMEALRAYLSAAVSSGRMSMTEALNTEAAAASRTGQDMPLIKNELNTVADAFGSTRFGEPGSVEQLDDLAKKYAILEQSHPHYLRSQLDAKALDWWETFMAAKRYGGMKETEAAAMYANRVTSGEGFVSLSREQRDAIRSAAEDAFDDWGWSNMAWSGTVEQKITDLAERHVRAGMNKDQAITAAKEQVVNSMPKWNGQPVIGLANQNIPDDFETSVNEVLQDYIAGDQIPDDISVGDLYASFEGSHIVFWDKDGLPLAKRDRGLLRISLDEVRRHSNMKITKENRAATEGAAARGDQYREDQRAIRSNRQKYRLTTKKIPNDFTAK